MVIEIRRNCPKCGRPMHLIDGSQRTTHTAIYYELECRNCLLRLDGHKPRRSKRTS